MNRTTFQELIEQYLKAYNTFDIEGMIQVLHEQIHFRNISNGQVTAETNGIEAFRTLAEQSIQLFSYRKQDIEQITVTADKAEVEIAYTGTLATDLPNGMKAGEILRLKGKSIYQIKEGKLILIEDYSN